MTRSTINRRTFAAGFVIGLPTAVSSIQLGAQTPASLIVASPKDLLDTLENTPIQKRYEGVKLEPSLWKDISADTYPDAIGGVKVNVANDENAVFGRYVVFADEAAARDAADSMREELADAIVESFSKTIENFDGEFIAYEKDGYHSVTLITVSNVLVIGDDSEVKHHHDRGNHHNRGRRHGETHQSIGHAAVLVKHLLSILNRQT